MRFGVLLWKAGRQASVSWVCLRSWIWEQVMKRWLFYAAIWKIALELSISLPSRDLSRAEWTVFTRTPRHNTLQRNPVCLYATDEIKQTSQTIVAFASAPKTFPSKIEAVINETWRFCGLMVHPAVILNWRGIHDILHIENYQPIPVRSVQCSGIFRLIVLVHWPTTLMFCFHRSLLTFGS